MSLQLLTRPLLGPESTWFSTARFGPEPYETQQQPQPKEAQKQPAARKRKAKMRVNRSIASELNAEEEDEVVERESKRQKTAATEQQQVVNISLSTFAWQFVLRLLRSQPPSEIPEELQTIMTDKAKVVDPTAAAAVSHNNSNSNGTAPQQALDKENLEATWETNASGGQRTTDSKATTKKKTSVQVTTPQKTTTPLLQGSDFHLKPHLKPLRVDKDAAVGKAIQLGTENRDGWSEAACQSTGAKIHYQICRDSATNLHSSTIQQNHEHLIGRAFALKERLQFYSQDDANLTQTMLQEEDTTISFSVWAFGNRRAKEKTLAATAVVTRATIDKHSTAKVFALALIAVDRQWRKYGIGRSLLQRVEKELVEEEGADWMIAHGLRPKMYLMNGYHLDPRELPCPFKPKDRSINFFSKALHPKVSLQEFKRSKPQWIQLCSESLSAYYADYHLKKRAPQKPTDSPRSTRSLQTENVGAGNKAVMPASGDLAGSLSGQKDAQGENGSSATQKRTLWSSYARQLSITYVNAANIIKGPRHKRRDQGGSRSRKRIPRKNGA